MRPEKGTVVRLISLALALSLVSACGFRPLYGHREGSRLAAEMAAIEVGPIPERLGVVVHNLLRDGLTPAGVPARPDFRLSVELRTASRGLVTEKDSQVRRFDLLLFANYVLLDAAGGGVLYQGEARSVASYNVVEDANFATLAAQQDAGERAARVVSDQIIAALALYFDSARRGLAEPVTPAP